MKFLLANVSLLLWSNKRNLRLDFVRVDVDVIYVAVLIVVKVYSPIVEPAREPQYPKRTSSFSSFNAEWFLTLIPLGLKSR